MDDLTELAEGGDDPIVTAILVASRALIAIAAVSLESAPLEVTLGQFRAIQIIATQGPQNMSALAALMRISPSSSTRLVERLERKGLVLRQPSPTSRRSVELRLTPDGERVVDEVLEVRRREIALVAGRLAAKDRPAVRDAFERFALAAGEPLATRGSAHRPQVVAPSP